MVQSVAGLKGLAVLTWCQCARINDVTGVIMLCRGPEVSLWTLNGDLILEQNIQVEGDDLISSCAFYEGSGNEYLERNLVFTGHRKGLVNVSLPDPLLGLPGCS